MPGGPFKGKHFRCSRQPWTALALDEMDRGDYLYYFATGSVQSGKTLMFFILPVMYHLFEIGEDVIVGCPDLKLAQSIYEDRILPAIQAGKTYVPLLPTTGPGSRGGKITDAVKFRNGATLRFMGATGGDEQRSSHSARVIVMSELDKMDTARESSREADPVTQMIARSQSFERYQRPIIYGECTLSTTTGRTHVEVVVNGTNTEVVVPCRHCGGYIVPDREHLTGWTGAANDIEAGDRTRYECQSCGEHWTEADRDWSLERPQLLSAGETITSTGEVEGERRQTRTFGLRWTCMVVSLLTMRAIGEKEWKAQAAGTEAAEKELRQFWWALPWEDDVIDLSKVSVELVERKQHAYGVGVCPPDTRVVVGIDIGAHWVHWAATAYDAQSAGRVVEYDEMPVPQGLEVTEHAILRTLRELSQVRLQRGWRLPTGHVARPALVGCDTGYAAAIVKLWLRESATLDGLQATRWLPMRGDKLAKKSYKIDRATGVWHFDSETWKLKVHNGFVAPLGTPGSLSMYRVPPALGRRAHQHRKFAKQICAEEWAEVWTEKRGVKRKYVSTARDNHWLDAMAMGRFGAELLGSLATATAKPGPVRDDYAPRQGSGGGWAVRGSRRGGGWRVGR